jgi:hypothetical protein
MQCAPQITVVSFLSLLDVMSVARPELFQENVTNESAGLEFGNMPWSECLPTWCQNLIM